MNLQQHSHPAIVSEEVFDLVQLEIEARREYGNQYSGKGLFASRIFCGDCGGCFGSKVWHSTDRNRKVIWRCNNKYEGRPAKEERCTTPRVTEFEIMDAFVRVMEQVIEDSPPFMQYSSAQRPNRCFLPSRFIAVKFRFLPLPPQKTAFPFEKCTLLGTITILVNELDRPEYRKGLDKGFICNDKVKTRNGQMLVWIIFQCDDVKQNRCTAH